MKYFFKQVWVHNAKLKWDINNFSGVNVTISKYNLYYGVSVYPTDHGNVIDQASTRDCEQ